MLNLKFVKLENSNIYKGFSENGRKNRKKLLLNNSLYVNESKEMETPTLSELTALLNEPEKIDLLRGNPTKNKMKAGLVLLFSDLIMLSIAMVASLYCRQLLFPGGVHTDRHFSIIPLLVAVFPIGFYMRSLYPGYGMSEVDELRKLSYSITLIYAILATLAFLFKYEIEDYSRMAVLFAWALSLPLVPIGRSISRSIFSKRQWWGIPVLIIGAGKEANSLIKSLLKNRTLGFRPVVAVDNDYEKWGYIQKVPVAGGFEIIPELAKRLNISHAIIAMPQASHKLQHDIIKKYSNYFKTTYFIPDYFINSSLWVASCDLSGILGMEVRRRLLYKSSIIKKRIFDLLTTSILLLLTSPLFLLISLAIKLNSRGKVFFYQERVGANDTRFNVIKFRTMFIDAEEHLQEMIKKDKGKKREWEVYHKISNDPRITSVGRILRKYSLDELPQLWNVLRGEMSLIGPRAIMTWEKFQMNGYESFILQVKPGLTGLWQITDRNNITFEDRLPINVYYIRNWSIFLDIYIVAKTFYVVAAGEGGN